jgi:hypothetical protein
MKALLPLSPLLAAAAILLAGNGLQGTLITLRAGQEGFDASLIGLMGPGTMRVSCCRACSPPA